MQNALKSAWEYLGRTDSATTICIAAIWFLLIALVAALLALPKPTRAMVHPAPRPRREMTMAELRARFALFKLLHRKDAAWDRYRQTLFEAHEQHLARRSAKSFERHADYHAGA